MHWSRRAALISGLTTLLAAPALTAVYVAANGEFGAGDPVQVCQMPRMYVVGREAPACTTYPVDRREARDVMRARWDSVVQWAVFGDSAYRVR